MRELTELKLIGHMLIGLYEKNGIDSLTYDQARLLTQNGLNRVKAFGTEYELSAVMSKNEILNDMVRKNLFKITKINNNITFSHKSYEICKYILVTFSNEKVLSFKLSPEAKKNDGFALTHLKTIYSNNLNLDIKLALDKEIEEYINKINAKKRYLQF